MRRRGGNEQSVKGQHAKRALAPSIADLQSQVATLAREQKEARERQTATAEVLRLISAVPADPQPVFEMIVRCAVTLCGSLFANVFRFDGDLIHFVASHNVGPSYVHMLRATYPMRPDQSQVSGRVLLTRSVVRLMIRLPIQTTISVFPAAWVGVACWECQCCAMAMCSASSWWVGPRPDLSLRPRRSS